MDCYSCDELEGINWPIKSESSHNDVVASSN